MKLLWDAIGSEFGARHELYELNYFGQPEVSHLQGLVNARQSGYLDHTRAIVEACMSEYDLTGWTSPDLINPNDVTTIKRAK
jgi:4-hydroxyphenylacetate 3-monooxygenase